MVARVVRIENKKLPMKDATKGMQVIGLGDGAVLASSISSVVFSRSSRFPEKTRTKAGTSDPFASLICR